MKRSRKILLLPVPPPFAGPEIIAREILDSNLIKSRNDIFHINSNIRTKNSEKGKLDIDGTLAFLKKLVLLLRKVMIAKCVFIYLSSSKVGFIRDSIYIFICKLFRIKCIAQYHGSNFRNFYNEQNSRFQKFIRFTVNKIDKILVLGHSLSNLFEGIYNKKVGVLPNGLNLSKINPKKSRSEKGIKILFMGHLIYSKGFYELIKAYKELFKKYNAKIQLVFAGENVGYKKGTAQFLSGVWKDNFIQNGENIAKEITTFVEHANEFNAIYLGYVSGEQKASTYMNADIFVLPSYSEGFSMACLEAMSYGLPVITTAVGAMEELVENNVNGFITPIGDSVQLKNNLETLINNSELRKSMSHNNIEKVKKEYDIEKVALKLLEYLN